VGFSDVLLLHYVRAWQEERGAAPVDPALVADLAGGPALGAARGAAERAALYARGLLDGRVGGDDARSALDALLAAVEAARWLAPALGIVFGFALVQTALPAPEARPANVFVFLASGVLLPGALLLLVLLLGLRRGRALVRVHWLLPLARLVAAAALRTALGSTAARALRRGGPAAAFAAALSHAFWTLALATLLVASAARFSFQDHYFCWSTTLPIAASQLEGLLAAASLPVAWLPGVEAPGPLQVAVSEWDSLDGRWLRGTGDAARDERLRKDWYALLLALVAAWGLLPRGIAWVLAARRMAREEAALLETPPWRTVLDALAAASDLRQLGDGGATATRSSASVPAPAADAAPTQSGSGGLRLLAFAVDPPGASELARLGVAGLGLPPGAAPLAVPGDDDDGAGALAAAALQRDGAQGALVAFDVAATPDRARERFLRAVRDALPAPAPVHVLLVGWDRFLRGPRAAHAAERHRAWLDLAARAEVPARFVHGAPA
jgi:hypothetical protein